MAFWRVLFVLLIAAGSVRADCECKPFWSPFRGNCYRLFAPKTWAAAEDDCKLYRVGGKIGHLASIRSTGENDFLQTMRESTVSSETQAWVGGNDIENDGIFVWTDGKAFTYENWLPNQPNNYDGPQNCISIMRKEGILGWNDANCDANLPYICETSSLP